MSTVTLLVTLQVGTDCACAYHVVYSQLTEGSPVERKMVMAGERLTSWFLSVISIKGSKIG